MKTITARYLNQNVSAAKRMAAAEPVVITDRGRPSLVLMSYDEFERIGEKPFISVVDAIADRRPEADFDWTPPSREWEPRKIDFD